MDWRNVEIRMALTFDYQHFNFIITCNVIQLCYVRELCSNVMCNVITTLVITYMLFVQMFLIY